MLDVHPPHEAAHSWKDFLIHIATIVVGVLIAIGLEQTVELMPRSTVRRTQPSQHHFHACRQRGSGAERPGTSRASLCGALLRTVAVSACRAQQPSDLRTLAAAS